LDIDGWLRGIGLAQYAEMFRANDIDIELLGRLTNDDLKDIGVVSFGHRKKLLEAIAALAAAPEAPSPIPVAPPEPAMPLRSLAPRSSSSKRLPRSRRVHLGTITARQNLLRAIEVPTGSIEVPIQGVQHRAECRSLANIVCCEIAYVWKSGAKRKAWRALKRR